MSSIRDIFGRPLEAGDLVILQNTRNFPAQILEISEVTLLQPGQPPTRTVSLVITVNLHVQEPMDIIPVFLTKKAEPKESLITQ